MDGRLHFWRSQADTACKNIIKLIKAGEPAEPAPAVVVADLVDDDTSSIDGDSQCGDDSDLDSEDEESKVTEEDDGKLLEYAPGPPAIKVTLGIVSLRHSLCFSMNWFADSPSLPAETLGTPGERRDRDEGRRH